jgi:hypothetical protein
MNIRLYFAFIYFNAVVIYAWQPFLVYYKPFKGSPLSAEIELSEEINSNNSTNHTFMDDEEFMKILRFYRPI